MLVCTLNSTRVVSWYLCY